ncbi:MAG: NAD-dependent epimerase/dehydratase family protein [Solirubrobacterales bacterium]
MGPGLTVAVTGPTGDIGRSVVRELEGAEEVERIVGMARRPFDPAEHGWERAEYRRGDVLDRSSVDGLVEGADVVVHLAFVIFGGREETRRVNLEGSRNVFEATAAAGARRILYTSSVAAYGFDADRPEPLTEEADAAGSADFYYSAQKAELERLLWSVLDGSRTDAYVFRPCIVAGRDAPAVLEQIFGGVAERLGPLRGVLRGSVPLLRPILPSPELPFQLVHHHDVAVAIRAAAAGRGSPGTYNLAAQDTLVPADIARELGWHSVPVPGLAVDAAAEVVSRLPLMPARAAWLNAFRSPVVMDCAKARRELGWEPRHDGRATLRETVEAGRASGLL